VIQSAFAFTTADREALLEAAAFAIPPGDDWDKLIEQNPRWTNQHYTERRLSTRCERRQMENQQRLLWDGLMTALKDLPLPLLPEVPSVSQTPKTGPGKVVPTSQIVITTRAAPTLARPSLDAWAVRGFEHYTGNLHQNQQVTMAAAVVPSAVTMSVDTERDYHVRIELAQPLQITATLDGDDDVPTTVIMQCSDALCFSYAPYAKSTTFFYWQYDLVVNNTSQANVLGSPVTLYGTISPMDFEPYIVHSHLIPVLLFNKHLSSLVLEYLDERYHKKR